MHKLVSALSLASAITVAAFALATPTVAKAHMLQAPCDFITSGGFVFKDNGQMANFGAHGGCKNGEFWGHVNYVDHDKQYHLNSTSITGYLYDPASPNSRDICGTAKLQDHGVEYDVYFRVRLTDNGEPGRNDQFGIFVDNRNSPGERFYRVSTRSLAAEKNGGGNVQLHKSNPSNTAQPGYFSLQEWQMCGDLNTP